MPKIVRTVLTHKYVVGDSLKRADLLVPTVRYFLTVIAVVVPDHFQTEDSFRQNLPVKLQDDFVDSSHGDVLYGFGFGVWQGWVKEPGGMLLKAAERDGDETYVSIELLPV